LADDLKVVSMQDWRMRADIEYAFQMAEDVPLDAALWVALEQQGNPRALLVAAAVILSTIVKRAA
jgi:hypothetical protein